MKFSANQSTKSDKLRLIATNLMVFVLFFTIGFWSYRLNVQTETSFARTVPTNTIDLSITRSDSNELTARVSVGADYQIILPTAMQTSPGLNAQETKIALPTEQTMQTEPIVITAVIGE